MSVSRSWCSRVITVQSFKRILHLRILFKEVYRHEPLLTYIIHKAYLLDCICRCADIWNVRMGVLVAWGGVPEKSPGMTWGIAASMLEFGGGIDMSIIISKRGVEPRCNVRGGRTYVLAVVRASQRLSRRVVVEVRQMRRQQKRNGRTALTAPRVLQRNV